MNADQIRTLKPGPELDRAVYHALFDEQASLPGPRRLVAYPSYSATWKALGLVVEEMADDDNLSPGADARLDAAMIEMLALATRIRAGREKGAGA